MFLVKAFRYEHPFNINGYETSSYEIQEMNDNLSSRRLAISFCVDNKQITLYCGADSHSQYYDKCLDFDRIVVENSKGKTVQNMHVSKGDDASLTVLDV